MASFDAGDPTIRDSNFQETTVTEPTAASAAYRAARDRLIARREDYDAGAGGGLSVAGRGWPIQLGDRLV